MKLAQGLSAVATRLEPRDAGAAAAALSQAMSKTPENVLPPLVQGLSAVLLRMHPSRSLQRQRSLVGVVVGVLSGPRSVLGTPALWQPAFESPPPPLPAQTLVDLLKHPFCVGKARRLVLDQLQRYQRPFADQWDFVRFALEHNLGLDFTTPPQRLAPPTGGEI
jgi:hypothetical protein